MTILDKTINEIEPFAQRKGLEKYYLFVEEIGKWFSVKNYVKFHVKWFIKLESISEKRRFTP